MSSDCEKDRRPLRNQVSELHQIHPMRTLSPRGLPSCVSSVPLLEAQSESTCPGHRYISTRHAVSLYLLELEEN